MTLLAGQESIMHNSDGFSASGKGIEDSRLTQLSAVSSATAKVNGARSEYVFNSFFFRGEYNYDEKYYLDASYLVGTVLHVLAKTTGGLLSILSVPCTTSRMKHFSTM